MPSGRVTRSTFFGSLSGSINTAATTGMPDSTRPSLPVKQTCLALASWPFRQNLVQGEKMSCGCSPAGACACGWAPGAPGASAGPFGTAFGAALGGALGAAGGGAGGFWAKTPEVINAVSMVVAAATANARAAGRAGAKTNPGSINRILLINALTAP